MNTRDERADGARQKAFHVGSHGFTDTGIATTRTEPSGEVLTASTCVVPPARAVTVPLASTVAMASLSDNQRADEPPAEPSDVVAPVVRVASAATVNVVLPVALDPL